MTDSEESNNGAEAMMTSIVSPSEYNTYPRTPMKRSRKKSVVRNRSPVGEKVGDIGSVVSTCSK